MNKSPFRFLAPLLLLPAPGFAQSGSCGGDDIFEENDSCGAAAILTAGVITDLELVGSEEDNYRITVPNGQKLTVTAVFSHAQADLDMQLNNFNCQIWIDDSLSADDNEEVQFTNLTGDPLDLVAELWLAGGTCSEYELIVSIDPVDCSLLPDDPLESNDVCNAAVSLTGGSWSNLRIFETDQDYYELTVPAFSTVTATMIFDHAVGNIDATLFPACNGAPVAISDGTDDIEEVTYFNNSSEAMDCHLLLVLLDGDCNFYDLGVSITSGQPGVSYCSAIANSTGVPARMSAAGTASISANDLVLVASPCPANQTGVFFHGPDEALFPFLSSASTLCVAFPVIRSDPLQMNGGALVWELDNNDLTADGIMIGVTRFFQAWYRDPGLVPPFLLSDAYRITFSE